VINASSMPIAEHDADHELVAAMDAVALARTQIVVVLLAAIARLAAELAAAQQAHARALAAVGDLAAIIAGDGGYMAPAHQAQFARARRLLAGGPDGSVWICPTCHDPKCGGPP